MLEAAAIPTSREEQSRGEGRSLTVGINCQVNNYNNMSNSYYNHNEALSCKTLSALASYPAYMVLYKPCYLE